jgi:hypothetical protein
LRFLINDRFHNRKQIEGGTGKPVDARDHHHIAGLKLAQQLIKFASVGTSTTCAIRTIAGSLSGFDAGSLSGPLRAGC